MQILVMKLVMKLAFQVTLEIASQRFKRTHVIADIPRKISEGSDRSPFEFK